MRMATTAAKETPVGYGNMKRKEDARFIRGKGKYLDDIVLPEMLYGAVLRSPYAHARIVSIDTSAALAHPKVHRVITAKDLETLGLAWMPTISYDSQAVVAGDKVRFQGQEVAFLIAEDRHPAPLETCGMIADMDPETGQLDIYNGNQAPNLHRTVYAQVAGLPEHMIRIMTNDIGGGFGNKVDRKSTRLNSSHITISYAVFCLKK